MVTMKYASAVAWGLALVALAAHAGAASSSELQRAERVLQGAAGARGHSAAEVGEAVAVLRGLADRRLPVRQALDVVLVAVERGRGRAQVEPLALAFEAGYRGGAEPRELVLLARDLAAEGVATREIAGALRALGRLAEDGEGGPQARREIALAVRHAIDEGRREEVGEAAGREARDAAQREAVDGRGAAEGRAGAPGRERAAEAHDRNELRDELRRNPPPGLTGDRPPGGVPRRGRPADPGRRP